MLKISLIFLLLIFRLYINLDCILILTVYCTFLGKKCLEQKKEQSDKLAIRIYELQKWFDTEQDALKTIQRKKAVLDKSLLDDNNTIDELNQKKAELTARIAHEEQVIA